MNNITILDPPEPLVGVYQNENAYYAELHEFLRSVKDGIEALSGQIGTLMAGAAANTADDAVETENVENLNTESGEEE